MQSTHTDITGIGSTLFAVIGTVIHYGTQWEPLLADVSYAIAIVAGVLTIYYKIKNKA